MYSFGEEILHTFECVLEEYTRQALGDTRLVRLHAVPQRSAAAWQKQCILGPYIVSGYYRNLGSLRAGTRHHGETLRYGNSFPPTFPEVILAHASLTDWPIVAKHANMPSSRGSINAELATITSESDTERRLAGRAVITAIAVMSRSRRSQGTEVTIVTGDVPYRAFTRHHGETLRYGNAIQSHRERGYGQPVPITQRCSIPTNNGAHRAGS